MAKRSFLIGVAIGGAVVMLANKHVRRATSGESGSPNEEASAKGFSITFGNPSEQEIFFREYTDFLIEWRELQEFVKLVMLNRTILPPDFEPLADLPDDDPRIIQAEDRYKADISSFMMARIAVDDFSELLTLASNGYGTGALKTLRGMYERVVTSAYVALWLTALGRNNGRCGSELWE
jgi:hypothetical protein